MCQWLSCSLGTLPPIVSRGICLRRSALFIAGEEYGPNKTPKSIGLYGGRYTIAFHPGESFVCCAYRKGQSLTVPVFVCTGIDYQYCENWNDLLEVERVQV
jgi:hypothetical protein